MYSRLILTLALILSVFACAQASDKIEVDLNPSDFAIGSAAAVEGTFQSFPKGELLGAIVFRKAWLMACPDEDCIILTAEKEDEGTVTVTGVPIYTKKGAVFAHTEKFGNFLISELKPVDLISGNIPRIRGEMQKVIKAGLTARRRTESAIQIADVLTEALNALKSCDARRPEAGGVIGANIAEIDHKHTKVVKEGEGVRWLVFDWNDWHCFYRPKVGVVKTDIPLHPITKRPIICGPNSEFVESAVFCRDYEMQNPSERATVIFDLDPSKISPITSSTACAAYTKKGAVLLFSPSLGEIGLRDIKPEQIYNLKLIHARYLEALKAATVTPAPLPFRPRLLGDTPLMIAIRAYQRLHDGSAETLLRAPVLHPGYTSKAIAVDSVADIYSFSYRPANGTTFFTGFLGRNEVSSTTTNQVAENVASVALRKLATPNEISKSVIFVGRERALRSVALYSYEAHSFVDTRRKIGLIEIEDHDATWLRDSPPGELLEAALFTLSHERLKPTSRFSAKAPVYGRDESRYIEMLKRLLEQANIECSVRTQTIERSPDGRAVSYSVPCLTFVYDGRRYTCTSSRSCFASDGVILK